MKQEPSKRRGKTQKSTKGRADFKPAGAAGRAIFDADTIASKPGLFWDAGSPESFLVENERVAAGFTERTWDRWPKAAVKTLLRVKHCVALKAREGERVSELERVLLHLRQSRIVDLSMHSIAGYDAGLHTILERKLLVRRSSKLVKPLEGNCDDIRRFIESRLDLEDGSKSGGAKQAVYFHGWARASLEARLNGSPGNWRPGQGLIFAGESDCGKSRLQHNVITPLLGGRSANPAPYLFGATDFNAEIAAAEHLLMEDPASGTRTFDRVHFGEMWKQLIVADTFRLHRKREDAVTVCPFFRSTISVNSDPDKMRVLPLLTPDMREKVMLFLVSDQPIPFPLNTMPQRAAFARLMENQMPAYAWWLLNEFKLPITLFHKRYGVRQWLHPAMAQELFDDTPAAELLAIIDAARFGGAIQEKLWDLESKSSTEGIWEGGHLELERLLLGSTFSKEAERLLKRHKIERLLSRLKEDEPARVIQHRTNVQRRWMIAAPDDGE
jgi:hypothetical protein